MKDKMNSFLICAYASPAYFCDRTEETEQLISVLRNGRERLVSAINRAGFIKKYVLKGSSSINAALKFLINNEYVFKSEEGYCVYDRFMELWLQSLPYAGIHL